MCVVVVSDALFIGALAQRVLPAYDEEAEEQRQLAMAIEESLRMSGMSSEAPAPEEVRSSFLIVYSRYYVYCIIVFEHMRFANSVAKFVS